MASSTIPSPVASSATAQRKAESSDSVSVFRVALSTPIATLYQEQADLAQAPLESLLAERLQKCATHTSSKPLYISDAKRQALDKLFGFNISTSDQLLTKVQQTLSVNINGIKVRLSPDLLSRLKTRSLSQPFDKFVAQTVVEELERFVGLR
jgi:hypothetical protein